MMFWTLGSILGTPQSDAAISQAPERIRRQLQDGQRRPTASEAENTKVQPAEFWLLKDSLIAMIKLKAPFLFGGLPISSGEII